MKTVADLVQDLVNAVPEGKKLSEVQVNIEDVNGCGYYTVTAVVETGGYCGGDKAVTIKVN